MLTIYGDPFEYDESAECFRGRASGVEISPAEHQACMVCIHTGMFRLGRDVQRAYRAALRRVELAMQKIKG